MSGRENHTLHYGHLTKSHSHPESPEMEVSVQANISFDIMLLLIQQSKTLLTSWNT